MKDLLNGWGISAAVFLPLVGAAVMMLIPRAEEALLKVVALVTSLVVFAIGIALLANFDLDKTRLLQFTVNKQWIPLINSRYIVGLDGISLPLFLLTVFIVPLVIIYSWNHFPEPHNPKGFLILILILETGMVGTFVAEDLILFFVFFELVLLPMYFMIGVWGGEQRQYASIKFFLYTLFGSALMLVSFLALYFLSDTVNVGGVMMHTFDMRRLPAAASGIAVGTQVWLFAGMFLGFGIKVPDLPVPHLAARRPHRSADPGFGDPGRGPPEARHVRLHPHRHPDPAEGRGAVGSLHRRAWRSSASSTARSGCLAQTDMKRLIAFSSVAHMGYVMLGIATLTSFGINAAIFGMVAHGLITGMLFFLAGSVKDRYHTLEIKRLGGLLLQAPRMGWTLGFRLYGVTRSSRSRRVLGRVPGDPVGLQPGARPERRAVPHVHGDRRDRHDLRRGLPAVAAPTGCLRNAPGASSRRRTSTTCTSPTTSPGHRCWSLILVLGVYPNFIFRITDASVVHSLAALGR